MVVVPPATSSSSSNSTSIFSTNSLNFTVFFLGSVSTSVSDDSGGAEAIGDSTSFWPEIVGASDNRSVNPSDNVPILAAGWSIFSEKDSKFGD